jgi:hypothetical protein
MFPGFMGRIAAVASSVVSSMVDLNAPLIHRPLNFTMIMWIFWLALLPGLGVGLSVWPCLFVAAVTVCRIRLAAGTNVPDGLAAALVFLRGLRPAPARVSRRRGVLILRPGWLSSLMLCGAIGIWGGNAFAQTPEADFDGPPGFDGPPPFGAGGPPGLAQDGIKLVKQFDRDGDKRLNAAERKAAREFLSKQTTNRRPGGPGGFGPRQADRGTPQPGRKISPAEVATFTNAPLYDPMTLRTLFIEFADADWEQELSDFYNTDVEVPAKLTVDGKGYPDVGIHFRGASSFFTVGKGWKRSLNVALDFVHADQNLGGFRTLNLLNSHEDPTFLRAVLYLQIAREYLAAPRANFVRVVINGEDWGVYTSVEQFNKDFVKDRFGSANGARWKVPGSPQGRAGLNYLGDEVAPYKRIYEIKSKDDPAAWAALIQLCKVLDTTPTNQLETALAPILDVDGVLKFLALENVLINNDGYWVRASDYNLCRDEKGRFHVIPYDANETFSVAGGPGLGGPGRRPPGMMPGFAGPREGPNAPGDWPRPGADPNRRPPGFGRELVGAGLKLDPLHGVNDATKPLRSRLLAVPALRERYLGYVRDIATQWLDWERLGPVARQYQALIAEAVKADTRKLDSTEAFLKGIEGDLPVAAGGFRPGPPAPSLRAFAEQRRDYLLNYTPPPVSSR